MIQETLGLFDEPADEDVYCLLDLVVKYIRNRSVEEAVH